MKLSRLLLACLTVLLIMNSNLFANTNIYDLGITRVEKVSYQGGNVFHFKLRKVNQKPETLSDGLFKGKHVISFEIDADKLNGVRVVITNESREDIELTGINFVNLLIGKFKNSETIHLSCGINSQHISSKPSYKLMYFQVNG
ncbi:MAG: hypothetical protein GY760_06840 [Deltaproteobacteria bacterium]|nr:hypothetical protein [Deltaproteobacteria bacterium]